MLTRKAIRYSENIHPIGDSPLKSSAQRSFAPLQKSRRNHRSYVWTESLSSMATCRRKSFLGQFEHLSHMWLFTLEMIGAAQLRVATEIAPKWPFLRVNRIPIQYRFICLSKHWGRLSTYQQSYIRVCALVWLVLNRRYLLLNFAIATSKLSDLSCPIIWSL